MHNFFLLDDLIYIYTLLIKISWKNIVLGLIISKLSNFCQVHIPRNQFLWRNQPIKIKFLITRIISFYYITHFFYKKKKSDLGLRCALYGRLGSYISFMRDFYLAARMRGLILVFGCCILVYSGNCCALDNLLYCTLSLFFVWHSRRGALQHVTFSCATSSVSIVYYILKKLWWRNVDVNTW